MGRWLGSQRNDVLEVSLFEQLNELTELNELSVADAFSLETHRKH